MTIFRSQNTNELQISCRIRISTSYGTNGAFTMFPTYQPYVASLFLAVKIVMASASGQCYEHYIDRCPWNDGKILSGDSTNTLLRLILLLEPKESA